MQKKIACITTACALTSGFIAVPPTFADDAPPPNPLTQFLQNNPAYQNLRLPTLANTPNLSDLLLGVLSFGTAMASLVAIFEYQKNKQPGAQTATPVTTTTTVTNEPAPVTTTATVVATTTAVPPAVTTTVTEPSTIVQPTTVVQSTTVLAPTTVTEQTTVTEVPAPVTTTVATPTTVVETQTVTETPNPVTTTATTTVTVTPPAEVVSTAEVTTEEQKQIEALQTIELGFRTRTAEIADGSLQLENLPQSYSDTPGVAAAKVRAFGGFLQGMAQRPEVYDDLKDKFDQVVGTVSDDAFDDPQVRAARIEAVGDLLFAVALQPEMQELLTDVFTSFCPSFLPQVTDLEQAAAYRAAGKMILATARQPELSNQLTFVYLTYAGRPLTANSPVAIAGRAQAIRDYFDAAARQPELYSTSSYTLANEPVVATSDQVKPPLSLAQIDENGQPQTDSDNRDISLSTAADIKQRIQEIKAWINNDPTRIKGIDAHVRTALTLLGIANPTLSDTEKLIYLQYSAPGLMNDFARQPELMDSLTILWALFIGDVSDLDSVAADQARAALWGMVPASTNAQVINDNNPAIKGRNLLLAKILFGTQNPDNVAAIQQARNDSLLGIMTRNIVSDAPTNFCNQDCIAIFGDAAADQLSLEDKILANMMLVAAGAPALGYPQLLENMDLNSEEVQKAQLSALRKLLRFAITHQSGEEEQESLSRVLEDLNSKYQEFMAQGYFTKVNTAGLTPQEIAELKNMISVINRNVDPNSFLLMN